MEPGPRQGSATAGEGDAGRPPCAVSAVGSARLLLPRVPPRINTEPGRQYGLDKREVFPPWLYMQMR